MHYTHIITPNHIGFYKGLLVSEWQTEMEKRADAADASVLFFFLGCANFLAVYAQTR